MSYSHYRGKLYTNKDIKGVFTEAKDNFSEAFDILQKNLSKDISIGVSWMVANEICLSFEGVFIIIRRDGFVEIGEGAA